MPTSTTTPQIPLRAVFMRGGTSRALFFRTEDLPHAGPARDSMILAAMGSPDPNKRQLDGMGAGTSSTSKIAIIAKSSRTDADIDYTFGQVSVDSPVISYKGNCGNISSAVGPYAVEEGLVAFSGDEATIRIHNTNTGKIIVARFALQNGLPKLDGDFALDGIAGTASPIALSFLAPGGSSTGKTLPTGLAREMLETDGFGAIEVSLVDVSNPIACVAATDLGLTGRESPTELTDHPDILARIETVRIAAAVRMGICSKQEAQSTVRNLPQIAIVSSPTDEDSSATNIVLRMISTGQAHASSSITGGMCLAATMILPGSVAHELARTSTAPNHPLTIAHPSGTLALNADISGNTVDDFTVHAVAVFRTARRLMQGEVLVPSSFGEIEKLTSKQDKRRTAARPRIGLGQARALCELSHEKRIALIAEGLPTILDSAESFADAARKLGAENRREAAVLDTYAREEAAKILILIDGLRCPRNLANRNFGRVSKNYYSHFARLTYDDATSWKPRNIEQLREYVDGYRASHYVEGDFGEFILPNETIYLREANLYADIQASDKGDLSWNQPLPVDELLFFLRSERGALKLAKALQLTGLTSQRGLHIIADVWGAKKFEDTTEWSTAEELIRETIRKALSEDLNHKNLEQQHIQAIYELWQMPMYGFDFSLINLSLDELNEEQQGIYLGQIGDHF